MYRALLFVVLALAPSVAHASAAPPPTIHLRDAIPSIAVEGDLEVTRGTITIACGGFEFVDAWVTCTIDASLQVQTDAGAVLTLEVPSIDPPRVEAHAIVIPDAHPEDSVTLGGRPLIGTAALTSGMSRTLVIHATRNLHGAFDSNDYLVLSSALVRHPLLSESHTFDYEGDIVDVVLLHGDVRITGPVCLDARQTSAVEVRLAASRVADVRELPRGQGDMVFSIALNRERDHEGPIANGGVSVLLATRTSLDLDGESALLLAVAYEVIVHDFIFVSLGLATDFDAVFESLVVEVATPNVLFMIPSLSVGLGVVARQLGERSADAALRLRVGGSWPMLGVSVDVDYWPDLGQWTLTGGLGLGF